MRLSEMLWIWKILWSERKSTQVRGTVKSAVLEGGVNLPSIIVSCVYEKKPVNFISTSNDSINWVEKVKCVFSKRNVFIISTFYFSTSTKTKMTQWKMWTLPTSYIRSTIWSSARTILNGCFWYFIGIYRLWLSIRSYDTREN